MTVRVLFFGPLRDLAGFAEERLTLPEPVSLGSLFDHYCRQHPALASLAGSIQLARNQEFASRDTLIADGDEVAFLPPVSGGSEPDIHEIQEPDGHWFALTRRPIDLAGLAGRLLRGEDGAVVQFSGVARNNTNGRATLYLDYEGYEAMAIRVLAELGRDIAARHSIGRIAMVHRLGRLQIGEASVAVVVTAPHRRPAFEAALEGINRLKKTVPIWKKEYFADGEVWVDGEWDDALIGSRAVEP